MMKCEVKTYTGKNGTKTKYAKFGSGEKIFVMFPGLSVKPVTESAEDIAKAYKMFGEEFTVYVFDRPEPVELGVEISDIAESLYETLTSLRISGAYFFGASQGGMILQSILISHPRTAKKAVLGSTVSRIGDGTEAKIREWVSLADEGDCVKLHLRFFKDIYSEDILNSFGENIYSLIPECEKGELERFIVLANACIGFDVYNDLDKIKCPVLVLGSKKDKVMGEQKQEEIAEKLNCEIYMYDEFSHAVYDEAPDYKQRLFDFFTK